MTGHRALRVLALLSAMFPGMVAAQGSGVKLSPLFTDGVVLQRQATLPVWGTASPGSAVTVSFRGVTRSGRADANGGWRVVLPPQAAGGPFTLTVKSGGSTVTLHDVLVGDVWVASGQSNMEFTLAQATTGKAAVAAAHDSLLRHFYFPHAWSPAPKTEVQGGPWNPADPEHAGSFTAVGYYFARDLRSALHVPIGILHTSWGGANIETWISGEGQGLRKAELDSLLEADRKYSAAIADTLRTRIGGLPSVDSGLVAGKALWADPALDDASWATMRVPGPWEEAGYPGLDGVAWYRKTFELTAAEAGQPVTLALGPIDDDDITWVNGVEVGRTSGYNIPRVYTVPASALRAGPNVIAVRVYDGGGGGGITGPGPIELRVGGDRRSLAGAWKFRVGIVQNGADGQRINKIPTYLYNAMVYPLLDFPIKGVIWYQGESNANTVQDAAAYRKLMAELVTSWRKEWKGTAGRPFPVLWVQLPNFGVVDTVPPAQAAWATLRESQTATLSLPNTGQAVIIDVGEPLDIHPKDKETVGKRLALVGLKVAYGKPVEASGPTFRSFSVADGRATIRFDHAAGLTSKTPQLKGFAVAGADRKWVWADARIEGDHVLVSSAAVPNPVAVRYAWSNSPAGLSLYNGAGLPAAPFRTDSW